MALSQKKTTQRHHRISTCYNRIRNAMEAPLTLFNLKIFGYQHDFE